MDVVLVDRNDTQRRRRLCRRGLAQVLHVRVDRRIIHAGRESTRSNKSGDGREYSSPHVVSPFWFGAQRTIGRPVAARCYALKKGPG